MKLAAIARQPWTAEQEQILRLAYECAVLAACHPTLYEEVMNGDIIAEGIGGAMANLAKSSAAAAKRSGQAIGKWGQDQMQGGKQFVHDVENSPNPWKTVGKGIKQATPTIQAAGKAGLGAAKWTGQKGLQWMAKAGGKLKDLGGRFLKWLGTQGQNQGGKWKGGSNQNPFNTGGDPAQIQKLFMRILGEIDHVPSSQQKAAIDAIGNALAAKAKKLSPTAAWTP